LTFNATAIGLGARLAELGCLPVVIDELGAAGLTAQAEESLAFRIAAGAARTRGTRSGGSATSGSWESTAITSGNARLAPGSSNPGLAARVVNISAPITRTPEAARELAQLVRLAHGWPLRWLAADPRLERVGELAAAADLALGSEAGGVGGTVAAHLALAVAGAAVLGERLGIPELSGAALAAAREVADEAEEDRLEAGESMGARLLDVIREDLARQPTRYADAGESPDAAGRSGFAPLQGFADPRGRLCLFAAGLADIAERAGIVDPRPALRELADNGCLLTAGPPGGKRRLQRCVRLGKAKVRVYVFKLPDADPDADPDEADGALSLPSPEPPSLPFGRAAPAGGAAPEPARPTGPEVAEGLAAVFSRAESEPELRELADAFGADLEGLSPQLRADVRAAYGRRLAALRAAPAAPVAPAADGLALEGATAAPEPERPAPRAIPRDPGASERRSASPPIRSDVSPSPRIPVPTSPHGDVGGPAPGSGKGDQAARRALILATDGRELVGAGERVPLPEHMDGIGALAAAALELAEPGQRVILAIHERAHDRLGLPARPTDPASFMDGSANVDVRQVGNSGWRIIRTPAGELHVMAPMWSGDFRGAADAAELRDALAAFAGAVGWDWLYSGASTVHHLVKRLTAEPMPVPEAHPQLSPEWQGMAASVPAYAWLREMTPTERAGGWVRLFDRSGSYLAAWEGCPLPVGEWRPVEGPFPVEAGAETSRPAGYWLIDRAELEAITPPDLPDPFARWGDPSESVWLTTPLLQLAVEMAAGAGVSLTCRSAWLAKGKRRTLEAAGRRLSAARSRLTTDAAAGSAPARLALDALKEAYAGAVAWLEFGPKPPDPLGRPDWRRTLLDRYSANVYRNLAASDPRPFGLSDVDCAAFALASPVTPRGLRLGTELGAWKPKGRPVPMGEALTALEADGMHGLIRLALEVG
jgi:hypothetical protein